ncbi:hypothetical protein, partial [Desulfovibrio sp.]|uniref:hypothetical protein n=1 Tax=Desulfovibrio sp. TaxID=885 RepID=UPI003AB6D997
GVFCKNCPFLPPGPHPTPKKLFSGLHAGPRRCVVVAGVAARMSKACLAQAFLFWAFTPGILGMQERKASSRHDASPDQASAGEEEESL